VFPKVFSFLVVLLKCTYLRSFYTLQINFFEFLQTSTAHTKRFRIRFKPVQITHKGCMVLDSDNLKPITFLHHLSAHKALVWCHFFAPIKTVTITRQQVNAQSSWSVVISTSLAQLYLRRLFRFQSNGHTNSIAHILHLS